MIRFSTKNRLLLGFCALLAGATSCTDVDDELGMGFIPSDQNGNVLIDSSFAVSSYTVTTDEYPSGSTSNYAWLGSFTDPVFGNVTASFAAQYYPTSGLSSFKANVHKADSSFANAYLVFKLVSGVGDSTSNQTVTLYKMLGGIYADSVYYSNHNFQDSLDTTPIGSVTYNRTQNGYVRIPLTRTFLNPLLKVDTSKLSSSSDFLSMFKGIYFKSTKLSSGGALNQISFADSAAIQIYYNIPKKSNATQDSLISMTLSLQSSNTVDNLYLLKVANVSHDYNGSIGAADLNGTTKQPKTYLQGLGGLRTKIVFDEESVKVWENSGRNIHRVEMIIPLEESSLKPNATYPYYGTTPSALTAYYHYNADTVMFVPDMVSFLSIPTNAYLNRSTRAYSINITSYFKNSMRLGSVLPRELYLYAGLPASLLSTSSTSSYNYMQLPSEFLNYPSWATLQGTVDGKSKIQIRITYSN